MNSPLVEVKNLKKYFNTKKGLLHAVDDVSFVIKTGETLGIVGESGCGKTTTGRAVLRLVEPTDGQIIFDGEDVRKLNSEQLRKARKKMQIVFQDPFASLNPRMSISEIIAEPLTIHRVCTGTEKTAKIQNLMETVGLSQRLINVYPHELDGGRRQRVGVARALALNPKFIVCDEPVSALDVSIQAQILNLMQDLQEQFGLTYMFISHDLSVVKHISTRIAVMYLGKIVEITSSREIFKNPLHPYTQALLSAIPIPKLGTKRERIILEGDVPSPINPPKGCRFAKRCRIAEDICKNLQPELKDMGNEHFVACHLLSDN